MLVAGYRSAVTNSKKSNMASFNPHMLKVILLTFVLKGGGKTTLRCISASRLAWNKIPTATLMFSQLNF